MQLVARCPLSIRRSRLCIYNAYSIRSTHAYLQIHKPDSEFCGLETQRLMYRYRVSYGLARRAAQCTPVATTTAVSYRLLSVSPAGWNPVGKGSAASTNVDDVLALAVSFLQRGVRSSIDEVPRRTSRVRERRRRSGGSGETVISKLRLKF